MLSEWLDWTLDEQRNAPNRVLLPAVTIGYMTLASYG